MTQLVNSRDRPVMPPVVVIVKDERTLKLLPDRGDRMPFTVSVVGAGVVSVVVNNRSSANYATFTLRGLTAGDTRLSVQPASGIALTVAVRVLAAVALPDPGTNEGMLTRLFLAENRAPGGDGYTAESSRESMTLMRLIVDKRLAKPDGRWSSAGATSMRDVVRASGQFHGFETYPKLSDDMVRVIDDIVRRANTASDGAQAALQAHVRAAIEIASGPTPRDPTPLGLYWWRKTGSGTGGMTDIKEYKKILGNTFFQEDRQPKK